MICPPCREAGNMLTTWRRETNDAPLNPATLRVITKAHELCRDVNCPCRHRAIMPRRS